MTAELTLFGKEIGKGSKIVAEFNKAMPDLMQHGREAVDVFKGLAQQSEQLGIKTQKLTNVAKKYNTFQDAAKHAGRLNAMLGGNMVNSIDLLMAKEDERIEMLRRSVKQSGQAWQAMGRFQKQAIASAAGIKDMAMASKLFGGSVQEYERAASEMEKMRKVQERLNEQSKRSASLMKQLKLLVGTFVIPTGELVDVLSTVVDWLAWVDKGLREHTDGWASVANIMIGVVGIAKLFGTSIIGTLIGGLKKAIFWVGSTAASMVGLTKAENGATKASAKLGKAMGGLGASILAIGAGVGIAAAGIGYLASSMSQLDPEKWKMFKNTLYGIAAGLAVMTIAVVAAATALAPSVPVLVGLGAALMMIGAGVGMAAAGFGVLFSAIGGTKRIMAMTKMFAVMATSLSTIAVVSGIAGAGITAFSAAVTGLAGALALLPEEKMVKFSTMMNSTSDMLEQANSASPKQVQVVKEIVKQSKEYHKMIAESEAKGNEDLLQKLLAKVENVLNAGGAGGGGGGKAAAGSGKIVVPLEIGGRQFKKFIIDTVNEEVDVKNDMF